MKSAKGAYLFDVDGNNYIDYINSWGPQILATLLNQLLMLLKMLLNRELRLARLQK